MAVSSHSSSPDPQARLDSWKAIAEYLRRDVATVRRWEKELGLPVRRVPGGRGRSVFAYTTEIDAWLTASTAPLEEASPSPQLAAVPPRWRRLWLAPAGVAIAVVAGWLAWPFLAAPAVVRVDTRTDAVVAVAADGREVWRHAFTPGATVAYPPINDVARVLDGRDPSVLVATSNRFRQPDETVESGELLWFDRRGALRRTFAFDDRIAFAGTHYGAPWAITAYAADDRRGERRIAVASHHWLWHPSVVTILDAQWQRRGTFVHAGWVETVRWLPAGRLLIAGFSQSRDGGMVALLDPAALDGQGPEAEGSPFYCSGCGPHRPLRMIAMPRSEVNRASRARFNRAIVEMTGARIIARTIEVPATEGQNAIDAVYEFTPDLEVIGASFGEQYWELHDALERAGKIDHPRERCPDRHGPHQLIVWEPQTGWHTRTVPRATTLP